MRTRKNPPARLFGVVFILVGLAMLVVVGQQTVLTCTRLETNLVDCNRTTRWLGLLPMGDRALGNVRTAWVDRSCDEDGCTYAVRLDTDQGEMGLVSYYSSGQKAKDRTAAEINAFLQNTRMAAVEVRRGPELLGILAALVFAGAGVAVFASAWHKGKPLSRQARQAMTHHLDTVLGPVAWQADGQGLDIFFNDEAVRILWQEISRAAMIQISSPNIPASEVLLKIPGLGKMLNMTRELGEEYRALVLARGKSQARAFRCIVPIMDPAAAVLVDDVRRNIDDRWLGELSLADQQRVFDV